MKVLVVEAWGAPFVRHQVALLEKAGHEVRVKRLTATKGPRLWVALRAECAAIAHDTRGWRPDWVHSYSAWPAGIFGAIVAARYGCRHLVHEHLSPPDRLLRLPAVSAVWDMATRVASPSKEHKADLEAMLGRPVCLLPNPIVVDEVAPLLGKPKGTRYVMVGRLEAQKGFEMAVGLSALMPDAAFFIIGDGSLRRKIQRGHRNNLHIVDHSSHPTVLGWMKSATAVLCPSLHESFGMVAAEAAALGIPVFATPVGAHPDYASRLVPVGSSPDVWAQALGEPVMPRTVDAKKTQSRFVEAMEGIYAETP